MDVTGSIGAIFVLFYSLGVLAVVAYVLVLATQFVRAQERSASALETIAQKLKVGD